MLEVQAATSSRLRKGRRATRRQPGERLETRPGAVPPGCGLGGKAATGLAFMVELSFQVAVSGRVLVIRALLFWCLYWGP